MQAAAPPATVQSSLCWALRCTVGMQKWAGCSFPLGNFWSPGRGDLGGNQVIKAEGARAMLGAQVTLSTQRAPQHGLEVAKEGRKESARRRGGQQCSWSVTGGMGHRYPG